MHAMVLAAGLGRRMRPLSLLRAKPVLPVLNRPLIHWTLELLRRHGVTDVTINLHHLPTTVQRAVGDGRRFGLRVGYSHEREILGTAGGLRKVRRRFGSGPLLVVNGDMVFDFDLGALLRHHLASGARATLALLPNPDPSRYPPVFADRAGRVFSLPGFEGRRRGSPGLFTGVHVLDPAALDRLAPGPSDSIRDLYAGLLRDGEAVRGEWVRGFWHDLSDPTLYLDSQMALLRRRFGGGRSPRLARGARVHPRARVTCSVIGAGCVVEAGARVRRSVLWEGVRVGAGAIVEDTVVTDGAWIEPRTEVSGALLFSTRSRFRMIHRMLELGTPTGAP
jgi:NDP-sugar pyrophosphorylase family protein